MNWLWLSILSALLLGVYDAAKKKSVDRNAVPAVLLAAVTVGGLIWAVGWIAGRAIPALSDSFLYVRPLSYGEHAAIFVKSLIVALSWTLAYFSLKRLPLSIAAPLRSTGPVWTIAMATVLMGERPSPLQWGGVAVVLLAFFRFSTIGRLEGIHFTRNIAVAWMIAATIVGAFSGLYDKVLLQRYRFSPAEVQCWFTIYLVIAMLPAFVYWWLRDRVRTPFQWRRSIPWIAILLLAADYAYFTALAQPGAMVSLISPVRRLAVVVALGFGLSHFKEKNGRSKAICVAGVLAGIAMIGLGA